MLGVKIVFVGMDEQNLLFFNMTGQVQVQDEEIVVGQ